MGLGAPWLFSFREFSINCGGMRGKEAFVPLVTTQEKNKLAKLPASWKCSVSELLSQVCKNKIQEDCGYQQEGVVCISQSISVTNKPYLNS